MHKPGRDTHIVQSFNAMGAAHVWRRDLTEFLQIIMVTCIAMYLVHPRVQENICAKYLHEEIPSMHS